jgi:hypothetical protein
MQPIQQTLGTENWGLSAAPTSSSLSNTTPSLSVSFNRLRMQFLEYGGLLITFLKLFVEYRVLVIKNSFLSYRLQMWEVSFLYLRVRIFLTRFVNGFPIGECWPRK